jgi:hypothetical protein
MIRHPLSDSLFSGLGRSVPGIGGIGGAIGGAFGGVLAGFQQQQAAHLLWQQQLGHQQTDLALLAGIAQQQTTMRQVSRRECFTVSEAEEHWILTPGVETFDEWLDGTEWRPVA